MALQIRRGTEAERLTFTPLAGELIYTTDNKQLFIGDGVTLGGVSISEQAQDALSSLIAGPHVGIYFTYNDAQNTLTATVTGGVDSLNTLTDVSVSNAHTDDILKYAEGIGWINGTIGIDVLNDVNIVTPVQNEQLVYNGGRWVNAKLALDNMSNVMMQSGLTANDILVFDGTDWTNGGIPLGSLTNVTLNNLQVNQVIKWNGQNWVNSDDITSSFDLSLDGLTDVILTTPTNSQTLVFNGSHWVNQDSINELDKLNDVILTTPANGQTLVFNGLHWVNQDAIDVLDKLNDVILTTPANGQTLVFNGMHWVNQDSVNSVVNDTTPELGGDLNLNGHNIIGTGDVTVSGDITATSLSTSSITPLNGSTRVEYGSAAKPADLTFNLNQEITAVGPTETYFAFNSHNTAAGVPSNVIAGDQLSRIVALGYHGTSYTLSSALAFFVDSDPATPISNTNVPGKVVIGSILNGDQGVIDGTVSYLTWDSKGRLGVGKFDATANLDVNGTAAVSSTLLLGRLTQTEINGLTPTNGMLVYNTTTNKFQGYENGAWVNLI